MSSAVRVFVGITGASGHRYARGLLGALVRAGVHVDLAVTRAGGLVLAHEEGLVPGAGGRLTTEQLAGWLGVEPELAEQVTSFGRDEVGARPASGSARLAAVVLCPTSMGTLARISVGFSSNLVERAADVALKEGRTLVLVPRETPLSEIHLENMLKLCRLGAVILPAAPGFYHRPANLDELVAGLVGKILARIGIEPDAKLAWGGLPNEGEPEAEEGLG